MSEGTLKTKGQRKVQISVYLTAMQKQRLDELQKRTRVPMSVYIREGIDQVLKTIK